MSMAVTEPSEQKNEQNYAMKWKRQGVNLATPSEVILINNNFKLTLPIVGVKITSQAMPLICFIKGNFRFYVVSNVMFSPGLSSGRLLYCETIKISLFVRFYYE